MEDVNIKKTLGLFILPLILAFTQQTTAATPIEATTAALTCNNCTESTILAEAEKRAYPNSSIKFIHGQQYISRISVIDLLNNISVTYNFLYKANMIFAPSMRAPIYRYEKVSTTKTNMSPQVIDEVAIISSLLKKSAAMEIPDDIADSAWDLVGAGYKQTEVINYYKENNDYLDTISNHLAFLTKVLSNNIIDINNITVTLYFSDGSKAKFAITGLDENGDLELDFIDGLDKDGNKIKDSKDIFTNGEYKFINGGPGTMQSFYDASARYGVNIGSINVIPSGTVIIEPIEECYPGNNDDNGDGKDDDACH